MNESKPPMNDRLERLKQTCLERSEKIESLNFEIEENEKIIERLNASKPSDTILAQASQQIAELKLRHAKLHDKIGEKECKLSRMKADLEEMADSCEKEKKVITELTGQMIYSTNELIRKSTITFDTLQAWKERCAFTLSPDMTLCK
jgi:chromosome segregation ATPase